MECGQQCVELTSCLRNYYGIDIIMQFQYLMYSIFIIVHG